jgi:hypothetical protein
MQHTAQDRCDKCQAQGYTTWSKNGKPLTFCGHHTNTHAESLVKQGFRLAVDDTISLHT